jgi:cation diffusion facilitator CzcD-associated flavoprotein CzcO
VAVIGTGSSAIQIIPQVQKTAKKLTAFMRSVTWISPPVGGNILEEDKKHSSDESQKENSQAQYWYTEEEKKTFREDPQALFDYRYKLESGFNSRFDLFIAGSETSKTAQKFIRDEMHRRIGPGHEELKERLIPKWAPGCRLDARLVRPVVDNMSRPKIDPRRRLSRSSCQRQ